MSAIAAQLWARLGNCMCVFAHAKKRAENEGHELRTAPWVGERIFTLDGHNCARPDGSEVETMSGYFQAQKDLIYTRADCRRWFKFRPEVESVLVGYWGRHCSTPLAHMRRGDFASAGYPLIGRNSIGEAMKQYLEPWQGCEYLSDAHPTRREPFTGELEFVPDFYRMTITPFLFRANSTFSYWAGVLGHGRVFSPRIDGLQGGVEHNNVPYEEGNHCRCADLAFVTDLHLKEE